MPGKGLNSTKLEFEKDLSIREPQTFHELRKNLWVFNYPNSSILHFYDNEKTAIVSSKAIDCLKGQTITGITSYHDTLFMTSKIGGMHYCPQANKPQSIHIIDISNIHDPQFIKSIPHIFSYALNESYPYYTISLTVSNELLFGAGNTHLAIYHYPSSKLLSHHRIFAPYNHPSLYITEQGLVANFSKKKSAKSDWYLYTADKALNEIHSYFGKPTRNYFTEFPLDIVGINYNVHVKLSTTLVQAEIYNPAGKKETACRFLLPTFNNFRTILKDGTLVLTDTINKCLQTYTCPVFEDFINSILVAFRHELLTQIPLPPCITEFVLLPFLISDENSLMLQSYTSKKNVNHFFHSKKNQPIQKPGEIQEMLPKFKYG